MIKQNLLFTLITFIALIGCSENNVSPPTENKGEFVVEYYAVDCTVKMHPSVDTLRPYVSYTLHYQFKKEPGTIDGLLLDVDGFGGLSIHLDYAYPDSIDKINKWSSGFWLYKSVDEVDSLIVNFSVAGAFWNRNTTEGFNWKDQRKIKVNR